MPPHTPQTPKDWLKSRVKPVEIWAKSLLALLGALLLWRPGRRRPAGTSLPPPRRVLLVRIDNRVGEALLTTPLLDTLRALPTPPRVDVLVHQKVERLLAGHPAAEAVRALDRRRLWLGAWAPGVRALRREDYDLVVDCGNWVAPSVTSALVARLVAPRAVLLGPSCWPVRLLHSLSVAPRPDTRSEAAQRDHLLSPLQGYRPNRRLSFRTPRPGDAVRARIARMATEPAAVVNPGGRLGWRRVPPEAFAAAARALVAAGRVPVVTWGPGEEALARAVVDAAPGAELAPPTTLDELAALMHGAGLTVCNNTGPMHLSVAVGAPTLALFLHMDMERWGHAYAPHRMVDLTDVANAGGDLSEVAARAASDFARTLAGAQPVA